MPDPVFDDRLKELRRVRIRKSAPPLFLAERAIEDVAERLTYVSRSFSHALIIGCPAQLAARLEGVAAQCTMLPDLDAITQVEPGSFDLLLVLGQLDLANELPVVLHILRSLMTADGMMAGVVPGGETLPALRTALLHGDQAAGTGFAPRVHPRIEASALAGLLQDTGFVEPVVDIDRVRVRYPDLDALLADLRAMGMSSLLRKDLRRPLTRTSLLAARQAFAAAGDAEGTVETFELIHFAAWTPGQIRG